MLLILLAFLSFGVADLILGAERGYFENEYGVASWETSLSEEKLTENEGFYATVNLSSSIKKLPEEYKTLIKIANQLTVTAMVSYEVLGRLNEGQEQIILHAGEISKVLPKIKEGAAFLELQNERIPLNGNITFPKEAKYGVYHLYIKLIKVKAKASFFSLDITSLAQKFLPKEAFESGISLGVIRYREKVKPLEADFFANHLSGVAPFEVSFFQFTTGGTTPYLYEWDFDNDGSIDSTKPNPTHIYSTPGTYTVSLIVTDYRGAISTKTKANYIVVKPPTAVEISFALAGIVPKCEAVWGFDASKQRWLLWKPDVPEISDLTKLEKGKGYWIKVKENCTLSYAGHSYTLYKGWNLIGWLG